MDGSLNMSSVTSRLDYPATYALDKSGMFERLARTGDKMLTEWTRVIPGQNRPGPITSMVIAGMGGSAVAGDFLRALAQNTSPVPVEVVRDFHMPAWVGPRTLVIACSHSGSTPETISAYTEARDRGAQLGAITSGGALGEMARADGSLCWLIAPEGPPRVASASILGVLLRIAAGEGIVGTSQLEIAEAAARYDELSSTFAPSIPCVSNGAKALAESLAERIPFVLGAGHLIPAATRFKNQLAENGKSLSAMDSLPEAGHNLVVGLSTASKHDDRIALVLLEGAMSNHFHVSQRFDLVAEHFERAGIPVHRVRITGKSLLGEQLAASAWADYTSAYVALLHGEDPMPVPQIDAMKEVINSSTLESLGNAAS